MAPYIPSVAWLSDSIGSLAEKNDNPPLRSIDVEVVAAMSWDMAWREVDDKELNTWQKLWIKCLEIICAG